MRVVDPVGLAKAILWEEAKGKLRAMVMAEGAQSEPRPVDGKYRFQIIEMAIEKFIKDFEDEGFHE